MEDTKRQLEQIKQENEELRSRLEELEEALVAIRSGEVDAIVVNDSGTEQVFTLKGVDHSYRVLVEEMSSGAMTLAENGDILYANMACEKILKKPLANIVGSHIDKFVHPSDLPIFDSLLQKSVNRPEKARILFGVSETENIPTYVSANFLKLEDTNIYCVVIYDLSEQERIDKIVAEERLSRSILAQASEIIIVCDSQGIIIRSSDTAMKLLGNDILNKNFNEILSVKVSNSQQLFSFDQNCEIFSINEKSFKTTGQLNWAKIESKNCNNMLFTFSCSPFWDELGNFAGVVIVFADISKLYYVEKQLEEKNKWFFTTLNSIGDGVIATDKSGRVIFMNPTAEEVTGYDENEVRGKPLNSFFHIYNEITGSKVENPIDVVIRTGGIVGLANHTVLINRNGQSIPIADAGSPIKEEHGDILGVVLIFRDQTEERNAQKSLKESEEQFRSLVQSVPGTVYQSEVPSPWRMNFISDEVLRLAGYPPEHFLFDGPSTWREVILPEDLPRVIEQTQSAVDKRGPFELEYRIRDSNGEIKWIYEKGIALLDVMGEPVCLQGIFIDITDRKVVERELIESKQHVEVANLAKSQFLATMSHELRTPLNGVLGMLQVISANKDLPPELNDYVKIASQNGWSLLGILNDILDLSKIEVGRVELKEEEFYLAEVVNTISATFSHQASEKGIRLHSDIEADVPSFLYADKGRIRQILFNLLGNAVKFTQEGEVF